MSQAHIPQPNSQSAAPAEVFDSTADAPHGQTVSALGTPGPRAGEVGSHAGQKNSFDISIHRQFIPQDTFIWSTSQTRGTLLWHAPIHPTRCNDLISYLSGMYNTWGGSIEYNFKVAGTGFHAGALSFVRIPPNFDPHDFTSPSAWGAFEYVTIDPKTLEVLSVDVMDQRPLMFHYMNMDLKNPMTFGGWIACYVLIPLNTSSTGSQNIAVQTFSRPGATFTLNQLIVPRVAEVDTPTPSAIMDAISLHQDADFGGASKLPLRSIYCGAKVNQKRITYATYNFASEANSPFLQETDDDILVFRITDWTGSGTNQMRIQSRQQGLMAPKGAGVVVFVRPDLVTLNMATFPSQTFTGYLEEEGSTDPATGVTKALWGINLDTALPGTGISPAKNDYVYITPSSHTFRDVETLSPDITSDKYFTIPAANEVFLFYSTAEVGTTAPPKDGVTELQTLDFSLRLRDGQFSNVMGPDDAMIIDIVDVDTKINLGSAKLYYEGFITTHSSFADRIFTSNIVFQFNSWANRNSPIPIVPQSVVNGILFSRALTSSSRA